MATSGAQPGNKNATKGMEWRQAIKRALAHRSGKTYREGLDEVATKFVESAANGDAWAMKEIGDRMDGKAHQSVDATVDANLTIEVVRFADTDPE